MTRFFTVILIAAVLASPAAEAADIIRVAGHAEGKHPPDVGYLNLAIWSKAKDGSKAQQLSAQEFSRIEKLLLQRFKIEKKQLKTTQLSLSPDYEYTQQGKRLLRGYQGRHEIKITVYTLGDIGAIVDSVLSSKPADQAVESSGVNVEGVSFGTEKSRSYEIEALSKAMDDAKARAAALAQAAGRDVAKVRLIVHNAAIEPSPLTAAADHFMMSKGMRKAAPTEVAPGEITVSADVTVEYEMN